MSQEYRKIKPQLGIYIVLFTFTQLLPTMYIYTCNARMQVSYKI